MKPPRPSRRRPAPAPPSAPDGADRSPGRLQIEIEDAPGERWVTLGGELDIAGASRLQQAIERLPGECCELIIDLRGVTFIDSSGLRGILMLARVASARGLPFSLTRAAPSVMRVFEICGLVERLAFLDPLPYARRSRAKDPPHHSA